MTLLRPYHQLDWPAVCAVHDRARPFELAAAGVNARAFRPMADVGARDWFFDSETIVASNRTGVVGFVSFAADYITWLYVDPSHFRRGIASALLEAALSHCGPGAWLHVLDGNAPAIALYRRYGFHVVKRNDSDCEGYPCASLRMARPTSPMHDATRTRSTAASR